MLTVMVYVAVPPLGWLLTDGVLVVLVTVRIGVVAAVTVTSSPVLLAGS